MVTELKTPITYQETFVAGKKDAVAVLQNFLQAGIFSNYVMYEKDNEVRIAGNELAKVSVSKTSVSLEGMGLSSSQTVSDPFRQVGELLGTLPLKDWTAYGYVAFDMVGFYSSYSKSIEQPLLYFLVPEIELRFIEDGVHVKSATSSLKPILELLSRDSQLPDYVPLSLSADFEDCEDYSHRIETLIEAIQKDELHKAIISRIKKLSGDLDVLGTYAVGAKVNNSARSYCLNIGDVRAVGFSPEILMQVDKDGLVVTNPLAGTRPRG